MQRVRISVSNASRLTAIALAFLTPAAAAELKGFAGEGAELTASVRERKSDEQAAASAPALFTGRVLLPNGEPAARAVVVTSAGGQSVTAADGSFELEVDVPLDADGIQVTAAASGGARGLVASTRVALLAPGRAAPIERLVLASGTPCHPTWIPTFGGLAGTDQYVDVLAVFDDGTGPALYVGGAFNIAGGIAASRIAKWDGTSWSALGTGTNTDVNSLAVFDDGSGEALYAGGQFTTAGGVTVNRIAKWDGTSWSALAGGVAGSIVPKIEAMAVFDDGSGPALYAAGSFTSAGGVAASNIAKWDGTSWSALAGGVAGTIVTGIHAMAVFDDGSGPALYAAGSFTSAGGVAASNIAKWDGTSWSALGSGTDDTILVLGQFDDGGGPALYAGGQFLTAGGVAAKRIAKWDGTSWSPLGAGMDGGFLEVWALKVFDDGSGPALFAGGGFKSAGGITAISIAKWNGASWSSIGTGMNNGVNALEVFDDGGGPALFAGGTFFKAGGVAMKYVTNWDGTSWSSLGSSVSDAVYALAGLDDGSGPALYAGGQLLSAGGIATTRVAKWNGTTWSPLGSGTNNIVEVLAAADDGSGPALYAGGPFTVAGGVAANRIAKWDGASWSALGGGMNGTVYALLEFNDGSGPALYAGGNFTTAGGVAANSIAKWDGTSWSPLGSGIIGAVNALAGFDDGSGPALYAAGAFAGAGGVAADNIAKWDGTSWSAVGGGMNDDVLALKVFDDGGGPALHAGGAFSIAGGAAANRIAKWDGTSWSALGGGLNAVVRALAALDDGSGPSLFAGGQFTTADGVAANRIAKWDGTSWSAMDGGMPASVETLAAFDVGDGPALYAGGLFAASPAGDSYLAKWSCPVPPIATLPGCAGNPATLEALAASAPLGAALPLRITGGAAANGLGVIVFGASGIDMSGCGLVVPGFGELLLALAPPPKTLASGVLAGGTCDLSPLVPSLPALSGVVAYLQGAAVDVALLQPIELTNALAVVLGP